MKKLWKDLKEQGCDVPEVEEFEQCLRKDKRLEFIDPSKDDDFDEDLDEEMENLGFYSGARVKLKAREITKENFQS